MKVPPITLVVPLFNEAARWDGHYWEALTDLRDISWLFVDDGSTDSTVDLIEPLRALPNVSLYKLRRNRGKANAVRTGLREAIGSGCQGVGSLDGDGAFHRSDVAALTETFKASCAFTPNKSSESHTWESIWASRVALAGRDIRRRASRHYIGRVIATVISTGLPGVPYDTQCGFKLFRSSRQFSACLEEPFTTRWFFDVELLQRWLIATGEPMKVWEVPLSHWRDVPGSKISTRSAGQIARELVFIGKQNRRLP